MESQLTSYQVLGRVEEENVHSIPIVEGREFDKVILAIKQKGSYAEYQKQFERYSALIPEVSNQCWRVCLSMH